MRHTVTLLPGEGIGPKSPLPPSASSKLPACTSIGKIYARALNTDKSTVRGEVLNTAAIDSVRRNRVALKGPVTTPIGEGRPA